MNGYVLNELKVMACQLQLLRWSQNSLSLPDPILRRYLLIRDFRRIRSGNVRLVLKMFVALLKLTTPFNSFCMAPVVDCDISLNKLIYSNI